MKTILLDVGNSRCKWGVWEDDAITRTGVIDNAEIDDGRRWRFAEAADQAFACSVASTDATQTLLAELTQLGVPVTMAETTHAHAGVRCAYHDPARMGVDRWMAVLAASRLAKGPALVIDAGTALTIDALDGGGQHVGGYIIPGVTMMQTALTSRTANIVVDDPQAVEEVFGCSTSEAVRNGALTAAAGAVQRSASQLAKLMSVGPASLAYAFTGGDGALLAASLNRADDFHANFVLDGLAIYAGLRA
ncbi:MAG: type III pantothenate kinase [Woeseiaceae bacterium]